MKYIIAVVIACSLVVACESHSLGSTKEEIIASATALVSSCGKQHNVSGETVEKLYKTEQLASVEPTENIKCFTKCVATSLSYFKANNDVDEERVLALNLAVGKDEAKTRSKIASCKHLYNGVQSCDDAFQAFLCFEKA